MPGVTPQLVTAAVLTETDTFMLAFILETSLSKPNQLRLTEMAVTASHPARDERSVEPPRRKTTVRPVRIARLKQLLAATPAKG